MLSESSLQYSISHDQTTANDTMQYYQETTCFID